MKRITFLLLTVLAVTGCSGSTSLEDSPVGTWSLVSINGEALPTAPFPDLNYDVVSSTLRFREDGGFSITQAERYYDVVGGVVVGSSEETDTGEGTWEEVADGLLLLELGFGAVLNARWTASEVIIEVPFEDVEYLYTR